MKIAVDIMSGEKSHELLIKGAIDATREKDINVILVGETSIIEQSLKNYVYDEKKVSIVHSSKVVTMNETPTIAIKQKPDASVFVAAQLVRDGLADAFVSPGNTGATLTAAYMKMGRLKGVARPAILAHIPKGSDKFTLLLDVGANLECKPINLVQFAAMGEIYAKTVMNIKNPVVGLLSNGTEISKGNETTQKAYKILKKLPLNFTGYIEGRDIFVNEIDVAICDGFVGNILLKAIEGFGKTVLSILKKEIKKNAFSKIGALLMSGSFKNIKKKMDYSEYGGALLIGINGTCVVTHGSCDDKELFNGIKVAAKIFQYKLNDMIVDTLKKYNISKLHWFSWE